jgi:hypothetical protein
MTKERISPLQRRDASGVSRRSRTSLLAVGLAGAATAVAVWSARARARAAVNQVMRGVNAARDRYWLARHPIDYA